MVLCWGCFDNSPQYDSPSSDTGAIHIISSTEGLEFDEMAFGVEVVAERHAP